MKELNLWKNQFVGELPIVSSSSLLISLDLDSNKLEGPIPTSIFNLTNLVHLDLSHNYFTGIQKFPSLLRNHSIPLCVDLSDNNIVGDIPHWLLNLNPQYLNLSHNSLMGFEGDSFNLTSLTSLECLDLNSNMLQGPIPLAPPNVLYLDYSNNNFTSGIPFPSGDYIPDLKFLSFSNNNFHDTIPLCLCNISNDTAPIIDLSNNSMRGTIPPCLIASGFGVLSLRRNNLNGNIPDVFREDCSLQALDLSDNQFQGTIPKSIVNCRSLELVNLGDNELVDKFPCRLMHISSLRVLVLRSNKLYGPIKCKVSKPASRQSILQIIDIAVNNFCGKIPDENVKIWTRMMAQVDTVQPRFEPLGVAGYYQDTVTVTSKSLQIVLMKILSIFTSIDFSCNHFEGAIPPSMGKLKFLFALNLSHNNFTGQIPLSMGNLNKLESLDLANNLLSGVIPEQLASLTFISYLNLSYNRLVGKIPTSTQLQSFSEWSYTGNKGLYGPPLQMNCTSTFGAHVSSIGPTSMDVEKEIDWMLICVEIGYMC